MKIFFFFFFLIGKCVAAYAKPTISEFVRLERTHTYSMEDALSRRAPEYVSVVENVHYFTDCPKTVAHFEWSLPNSHETDFPQVKCFNEAALA